MKDDSRFKLMCFFAAVLTCLVLVMIVLILRRNAIEPVRIPATPAMERRSSIIDLPGIGEDDDVRQDGPEVELIAYPTYHGEVSLDKIGDWLEDPTELLDNTSVSIEGSVEF